MARCNAFSWIRSGAAGERNAMKDITKLVDILAYEWQIREKHGINVKFTEVRIKLWLYKSMPHILGKYTSKYLGAKGPDACDLPSNCV